MKKLLFLFAITSLCFTVRAQVKVGSDKSFTARVSDYKTYGWSNDIDKISAGTMFMGVNGILIFNNESTRSKIKNAIRYEMDAKGYKFAESNPDMFVLFNVTEQPATMMTYNGYEMIDNGLDSVRTQSNVENTKIDAGTLQINLIDTKSDKVAWEGYASGILKPDMVNDESKIRHAVSVIFNEFEYRAAQ